jgi:hypothetical protein
MADSEHAQSEQLIEHLTEQISRWRLSAPAILLLQVTRPLGFIASQGLLLCQPLLSFVYDAPRVADYAELLADRASMDRLVARLEEAEQARGSGDKGRD